MNEQEMKEMLKELADNMLEYMKEEMGNLLVQEVVDNEISNIGVGIEMCIKVIDQYKSNKEEYIKKFFNDFVIKHIHDKVCKICCDYDNCCDEYRYNECEVYKAYKNVLNSFNF